MKLSKTKLKQIIKEELEGSSRDEAINSLKGLAGVFDKIDKANQPGGAEWPYVPGKIVSPANSSAAWMMMAEDIEEEYYDELQHAIDMLEDKEGTNPHGSRAVEHARSIGHPMADELAAAMTRAANITLPYMKSLVGSGSGMKENNMKLTKTKLKQIIKEEFENLKEGEQEDAELGRILANMVKSLLAARTACHAKKPLTQCSRLLRQNLTLCYARKTTKMKITKSQLKQIIKEEIKNIVEESDAAVTEFELYSELLEITKQLDEFNSKLNVSMGLTAAATKQSQLSDEVYEMIRRAIRGLDDARIEMAQAIGQDPLLNWHQ